jgi:hypothetical protein
MSSCSGYRSRDIANHCHHSWAADTFPRLGTATACSRAETRPEPVWCQCCLETGNHCSKFLCFKRLHNTFQGQIYCSNSTQKFELMQKKFLRENQPFISTFEWVPKTVMLWEWKPAGIRHQYRVSVTETSAHPCTNVPIQCILCQVSTGNTNDAYKSLASHIRGQDLPITHLLVAESKRTWSRSLKTRSREWCERMQYAARSSSGSRKSPRKCRKKRASTGTGWNHEQNK